MMSFVEAANGIFWGWTLIILLIATGILFSVLLKLPQIRHAKRMFTSIAQKKTNSDGVSPFATLCAAIGGQVGTGNLSGVATAIVAGGPGAVFWMWLIGILGMPIIFAEAVLAQLFREKGEDGTPHGGPAFYMAKGVGSKGMAVFMSVVTIIGVGFVIASLQCNSIAGGFDGLIEIPAIAIGIVVCALTSLVIFGGMKRISKVASYIVPFMAIAYLCVALVGVFLNLDKVGSVFSLIFTSAFGMQSVAGGVLGYTVKNAFRYGTARGLFSNEAGQGTTPVVHAVADVAHPATQGFVAMFGVLVDTLVICTSTAFIILCTGTYTNGLDGISQTQSAIGEIIGPFGPYFILICICFFAWTSLIANIYCGESNIRYLSKDNTKVVTVYRIAALIMLIIGSVMPSADMWSLADFFNALMIFPNLIALVLLAKVVIKVLKDYEEKLAAGDTNPVWDWSIDAKSLK